MLVISSAAMGGVKAAGGNNGVVIAQAMAWHGNESVSMA